MLSRLTSRFTALSRPAMPSRPPNSPASSTTDFGDPGPETAPSTAHSLHGGTLIRNILSSVSLTLENSGSVVRDHLASERTFLAYLRTSLGLASSGVGQFRSPPSSSEAYRPCLLLRSSSPVLDDSHKIQQRRRISAAFESPRAVCEPNWWILHRVGAGGSVRRFVGGSHSGRPSPTFVLQVSTAIFRFRLPW